MSEFLTITGFIETNPPVTVGFPSNGGLVVSFPQGYVVEIPTPESPDKDKNITISFPEGFNVSFPGGTGLQVEIPGNEPVNLPEIQGGDLMIDLPFGGAVVVDIPFKQPIPHHERPKVQVAGANVRLLSIIKPEA